MILHSRSMFARHGIPEVVVSDNGPQFSAELYAEFARQYGFKHITSSPYHPQCNGEAERAVKNIKSLLKKSGDHYLALLAYRSTPLECGFSPAQLLMSRNLRTTLPMVREQRTPRVVNFSELEEKDHHIKERQRRNHDQRHRAKELPLLEPGDAVWILDQDTSGIVVDETAPRSHVVETSDGSYRRNHKHLVRLPIQETDGEETELNEQNETLSPANSRETRSKTGRMARPPDRLDPSWT